MKLPDSVRIGGLDYEIYRPEAVVEDGEELAGSIDYMEQRINVSGRITTSFAAVVIWHEVLHGILCNAGYSGHDEKMIEAISYGLVQVLRDNPDLGDLGRLV